MTALVFFLIGGCQQEELGNMNEEKPYLYLTSDRPFEDSNDLKTLFMAFERTNLVHDNGLYKLKVTVMANSNTLITKIEMKKGIQATLPLLYQVLNIYF